MQSCSGDGGGGGGEEGVNTNKTQHNNVECFRLGLLPTKLTGG